MNDFSWRISGKRLSLAANAAFLKKRIDELVERVEAVLGIYPDSFHFDIYLEPEYHGGDIAFYSSHHRSITVAVDRVTDGVLAHEIAHAVINAYFKTPPPQKVQEILAQYVDRHLWGE